MKTLHLTLKKKWFDMILSGEKKEEYRLIKGYWFKRFVNSNDFPEERRNERLMIYEDFVFDLNNHHWKDVLKSYYSKFNQFDVIVFRNGYSKNAPEITIECLGIEIGNGKLEWGSIEKTFVIKLGQIIETKNIPQ